MGVYIKGMEMPKCCSECLFRSEFFTDETYGIAYGCNLNISIICHDEYKERKDDCPLAEIPTPHGRLIDADALMKEIQETCKRLYGTDDISTASPTLSAFKLYIGEAPTIIDAEEET